MIFLSIFFGTVIMLSYLSVSSRLYFLVCLYAHGTTQGPVAIRRDIFAILKKHASDYCNWDDYNWDCKETSILSNERNITII